MPEEDIEREVDLLLRFVKLENEVDKLPNELSGGMQKTRCYSTRAVGNPKIVLFDEPNCRAEPPTAQLFPN